MYFFISFFVLQSLLDLILPIEFNLYANLISALFFTLLMTPFFVVLICCVEKIEKQKVEHAFMPRKFIDQ